jgi:hypothetical protein
MRSAKTPNSSPSPLSSIDSRRETSRYSLIIFPQNQNVLRHAGLANSTRPCTVARSIKRVVYHANHAVNSICGLLFPLNALVHFWPCLGNRPTVGCWEESRIFASLKGSHCIARGNAPGLAFPRFTRALQGRYRIHPKHHVRRFPPRVVCDGMCCYRLGEDVSRPLCRPCRASGGVSDSVPGALPQAVQSQPFRLNETVSP